MNAYCVLCEGPCAESCKKDERAGGKYCDDCDGPCDGVCRKGKPLTTLGQQVDLAVKSIMSHSDEFLERFYEKFRVQYEEHMFLQFARSRGIIARQKTPSSSPQQSLQDATKQTAEQ